MNDVCREKHKAIDEKLEEHNRRITKHGEEIEELKGSRIAHTKDIKSLCEKIDSLVKTIDNFSRLLIGTIVTGFIGGIIGLIFLLAQKGLGG